MTTSDCSTDLEQRAGRIVRQGNENEKVNIYRYITENTFDSYLWQIIENKQRFISQVMTSKTPERVCEDLDEATLNYAEIKALATGNPLLKEKMNLDIEIQKLKMLEANHNSNKFALEHKVLKDYPEEIQYLNGLLKNNKNDLEKVNSYNSLNPDFSIEINNVKYTDKKESLTAINNELSKVKLNDRKEIGIYKGLKINAYYDTFDNKYKFRLEGEAGRSGEFGKENIVRLDNVIANIPETINRLEDKINTLKNDLEKAKLELNNPFDRSNILKEKMQRLVEVNNLINSNERKPNMEVEQCL